MALSAAQKAAIIQEFQKTLVGSVKGEFFNDANGANARLADFKAFLDTVS